MLMRSMGREPRSEVGVIDAQLVVYATRRAK
jgi:hypothetical protein